MVRFRVRARQQETALISKAARKLGLSATQFLTYLFRGFSTKRQDPNPSRIGPARENSKLNRRRRAS